MDELWNFVSDDDQTVSLHDCVIDRVERRGEDWVCRFSDGFDVCRENRLNSTGRHRRSGRAVMVLQNVEYLGGKRLEQDEDMTEESFWGDLSAGAGIEVLAFVWDRAARRFVVEADLWKTPRGTDYVQFELAGDGVRFCWNDLPVDAWFQG